MYSAFVYLCVYSFGSFHMRLVLTVEELVTVRKWHLLNSNANKAYLDLEKNKNNPCLKSIHHFKGRIKEHLREIDEVDYHINNRSKWNSEVRSKQLKA